MNHAGFKIKTLKIEIAQDRPYSQYGWGCIPFCLGLFVLLKEENYAPKRS